MPILPNEKKALSDLRTTLMKNYRVLDFRIYGSKAKGTDVEGSDLDIMIVLEDHLPLIESEIDDLVFEINLKYDCFIVALFFSRQELEIGSLSESPIYKKVMQEGISL